MNCQEILGIIIPNYAIIALFYIEHIQLIPH